MTTSLPEPQRVEWGYRADQVRALMAERDDALKRVQENAKLASQAIAERDTLRTQLEAAQKDAPRIEFVAIYGSFGCDSVSGLLSGNGQKRLAATRKNIDAAIAATKGTAA
jgi:hypothetical protein